MSHTSNLAIDNQNFLKEHTVDIYSLFPAFDSFPLEEKMEIRRCLENPKKSWARNILVYKYGLPDDSDTSGNNQTGNGSEKEYK